MSKTHNLTDCSAEEIEGFLHSFDIVLSDCDGVLWHIDKPIDGAVESLKRLENFGKKLYLLSNNSTVTLHQYQKKVQRRGLEVNTEQIINTSKVIAWYLNKIDFRGEAFAIGSPPFREVLNNAGIKLTSYYPKCVESNATITIKAVEDRPFVKAVIADFDLFCDWGKLAFAISCLKRKDVLYISGTKDEWVACGDQKRVLGSGPLIDIITKLSGRNPIECAKPSEVLKDYIFENCNVPDPKRCLLIGDAINYDMKFGAMCGFTKLFVGTGLDTLDQAQKETQTSPEFYIPSLGLLGPILDNLFTNPVNNMNS